MNEIRNNSVRVRYFWLVVWLATLLWLIGGLSLLPYLSKLSSEARLNQLSFSPPDHLLDDITIYHLRAMDGKLSLTATKLTILFEGIPMDENANGVTFGHKFPTPGTISGSGSNYIGSWEVKIIEKSGKDDTFDMQVNEYKMRLVDHGKALEIDGQVFPFEEPRTVIVSKDGKVTTQNAEPK